MTCGNISNLPSDFTSIIGEVNVVGNFKIKISATDLNEDFILNKLTAGTGITLTQTDIAANEHLQVSITNTAVSAGSYGSASAVGTFTVNAQGQLTAAANVTIAITSTAVTDFNEAAQDAVGGILTDTASVDLDYNDGTGAITATVLPAGVDHGGLGGLGDDDHTQYALLAGRVGNQVLIGGTASGGTLTLQSTANATKGKILFGTSAYDEVNNRLGVGTVTPGGNYEAVTNATNAIAFRHRWTDGSFASTLDLIQTTNTSSGTEFFRLAHTFGGNANNGFMSFYRGGGLSGGFLTFGSNGSEVMRINESGYVGIGADATSKFQVTSIGAAVKAVIIKGATSQTANLTEWQDSASTGLSAITSSGALGIGTTAPSELGYFLKSQNAGTAVACENVSSGTAAFASVEARNVASISSSFRMLCMGTGYTTAGAFTQNAGVLSAETTLTGGLNLLTRASAPMRFYTNGHTNERMRIDSAGLVGIGVTTPLYKLDVIQSTGTQIHFGAVTDQGGWLVSTGASQAIFVGGAQFSGSAWIAKDTTASYVDCESGVVLFAGNTGLTPGNSFVPIERARINANGTFAIGSTFNGAMFHVTNSGSSQIASVIKGATSQTANLTEWQNSSSTILGYVSAGGLSQFTGLGVGSVPPSGKIVVGSAPNIQSFLSQSNTYANSASVQNSGVNSDILVTTTANNANLYYGYSGTTTYSSANSLTATLSGAGSYVGGGLNGIFAQNVVSGSGVTVVAVVGVSFQNLIRSSCTVTDAIGGQFQPCLTDVGASTVTTVTGLWVKRAATATVTTERGLYIEASTVATNKFAIYSEGGVIYSAGDMKLGVAGAGHYVKEGSNATMGTATLVGGTVVVNTTKVTANSRIFLTPQTVGGTQGAVSISARVASTSFTILSTSALDTSAVAWIIFEPA